MPPWRPNGALPTLHLRRSHGDRRLDIAHMPEPGVGRTITADGGRATHADASPRRVIEECFGAAATSRS
jgi:hypothetical protein